MFVAVVGAIMTLRDFFEGLALGLFVAGFIYFIVGMIYRALDIED
jgi:hypothetical protein